MDLARGLMKTCWGMYKVTKTGLAPEIVWFEVDDVALQPRGKDNTPSSSSNDDALWEKDYTINPLDAHNLQRPETVESLFMMWRITQDTLYREWGWEIFQAFNKHTLVEDGEGYSSVNDVNSVLPSMRDNMESFWLVSQIHLSKFFPRGRADALFQAETLKYLYLLFSPEDLLPLKRVVFNTEAHVLPKIELGKFSTGWARKPRVT